MTGNSAEFIGDIELDEAFVPDPTPVLTVDDSSTRAAIADSPWMVTFALQRPRDMPPLLGRTARLISSQSAGRMALMTIGPEYTAVSLGVTDGSAGSVEFAKVVALATAALVGYLRESIVALSLTPGEGSIDPNTDRESDDAKDLAQSDICVASSASL